MSIISILNGSKIICSYRIDGILIKNTYKNMTIQQAKFEFIEYCYKILNKYNV